jgi:hypothetical protein
VVRQVGRIARFTCYEVKTGARRRLQLAHGRSSCGAGAPEALRYGHPRRSHSRADCQDSRRSRPVMFARTRRRSDRRSLLPGTRPSPPDQTPRPGRKRVISRDDVATSLLHARQVHCGTMQRTA